MAVKVKWLDGDRVQVDPPKKPLKITGTRFAAIMGLNKWSTPFKTWCEITRTYKEPFEDTIYTIAGKKIEPKQAAYMRESYAMTNLITPEDVYGADHFKKTRGDFFPENQMLGGMWDYLLLNDNGTADTVLEMKTTKRSEDWAEDVPEYYAQQAALYAWLLGCDKVIMVCSFLADEDYADPDKYVPSAANTLTVSFRVSDRYPDMVDKVADAMNWWHEHVETGISPAYDEKADADILKVLRNNSLSPDEDIMEVLREAEGLKSELEAHKKAVSDKEKRLKVLSEKIREYASAKFRDGDDKVTLEGERVNWVLAKSTKTVVDTDAMVADGIFDRYSTTDVSYRLTTAKKEAK